MARVGIIGGSGLYKIEGMEIRRIERVVTPFGNASDEFTISKYGDNEIVFLPRHGTGHTILPTELNYRANIYGMKKLGVGHVISLSACGSFKKELKPRDVVIVDQFVDRTNQGRNTTFFGDGIVAHISFSHPICSQLADAVFDSAKESGLNCHMGGTYLNMEGPAFSTKAESCLYKSWGMDVIGMTNMPEARLCREAEICYSSVAFVTDYDCWHEGEEAVTIDMIIENLNKNVESAKKIIKAVVPKIGKMKRTCACKDALSNAIITRPEAIAGPVKEKLKIIIGKYIK